MKNLKQVLALGMAFSLTMSTMAGAAFTDSADIKATEAVDMLTALGVISGYEDGSFGPDKTVSRAEAAKMIYTIRNGGNDNADAFKNAPTTFTDLAGYGWAEGYIKYCQANGIIAGKSATKFDPSAPVTGIELAKMMLVSLGYSADKAGLEGATWATNTLSLASEDGVLKDVSADLSVGLPRQYAAQMMYNAIQAPTVRWSEDGNSYTDLGVNNALNETMGSKYMNLTIYEGILEGSGDFNSGKDKVKVDVQKIDGRAAGDDAGSTNFNFATDLTGMYKQYVKVLSDDKNNAYGVYAVSDKNTVATSALSDVKLTDDGKIKIGDTEYRTNVTNAYDISSDVKIKNVMGDTPIDKSSYNSADQITLVSNDGDEKFDIAFVNPIQNFGKVTYVADNKVIAAGKTYDADDTIIPEGLAKDDYVAVYNDLFTGDVKLVKAEKVTGKVTATRGAVASDLEVKVNDTWYKVAAKTSQFTNMVGYGKDTSAKDELKVKDTFDMYLIDGVVYGATKTQAGSTDTALVQVASGVLDTNGDYQVKLLFADGTSKVIGADKEYKDLANKLVTYTINSDGAYELDAVDTDGEAGGKYVKADVYKFDSDADRIVLDGDSSKYRVADDAIVYIKAKDGTGTADKVITGKQLNAFSSDFEDAAKKGVAVIDDSGIATVVYLANTKVESPIASGLEMYGVITSAVEVGDDYCGFTVWTSNGESIDVKVKGTELEKAQKGDVIRFETSENGYIAKVKTEKDLKIDTVAIKDYTSTYVTFYDNFSGGTNDYDFDSAKFIYMNTENGTYTGLASGSLTEAKPTDDGTKHYENAKVVLNNDGDKVVFVAVDVTGQWYGEGTV